MTTQTTTADITSLCEKVNAFAESLPANERKILNDVFAAAAGYGAVDDVAGFGLDALPTDQLSLNFTHPVLIGLLLPAVQKVR